MDVRQRYTAPTKGALYDCPWEKWGNWKYLVFVVVVAMGFKDNVPLHDNFSFHIMIFATYRYLTYHVWCTICRIPAIARKRQIQRKGMTFEQVDHEMSWENSILLSSLMIRLSVTILPKYLFQNLPLWNGKGVALVFLLHVGPVEWIYYWAHRILHHHFLYTRYHSHHHSSFVTQPITSMNHPMLELMFYNSMYTIPMVTPFLLGCGSYVGFHGYMLFIDIMNAWGHCNFEFVPPILFKLFPPLKYIIYTPSFHSLHHTKVHTNFALFMPLYDYIYGTMDSTSEELHHQSWEGDKSKIDGVYLTHLTEVQSMFHLPFGFQTFAAQPYSRKWHTFIMMPLSIVIFGISWLFGKPFNVSSHFIGKNVELQTWTIPRFKFQYKVSFEQPMIKTWIQNCMLEAQQNGAKVISLGLKNKECIDESLIREKGIDIPIVNGEALTSAIIVKRLLATGVKKVFLLAFNSRVGHAIATYLCEHKVNVLVLQSSNELVRVQHKIDSKYLQYAKSYEDAKDYKVWIVDEEIGKEQQSWAPRGTHFYNTGVFPLEKHRQDCKYDLVPGLVLPQQAKTINVCEDVMPRNVVRAAYAECIIHALEGWKHSDLHDDISMFRLETYWEAAMKHGFQVYNLL